MIEYAVGMYAVGAAGLFVQRVLNLSKGVASFRQGVFGEKYNVYLDTKHTTQKIEILNEIVKNDKVCGYPFQCATYEEDKLVGGICEFSSLPSDMQLLSMGKPSRTESIIDKNKFVSDNFDMNYLNNADKLRLDVYDTKNITLLSTDKLCSVIDKGLTNKESLYTSLLFNLNNRPHFMLTSTWLTTFMFSML